MQYPSFYDPNKVGTMFAPNVMGAYQAGLDLGLEPVDPRKDGGTALLLVDCQVDFIHTNGALSVPGAVEDTRRTIEWIFENVGDITSIIASLDSHTPLQIFSPSWWQDRRGNPPGPFTLITCDDVKAGRWQPVYETKWSKHYVEELEDNAKKQLMIWPYHTLVGTQGHAIEPSLYEAIVYHMAARGTQYTAIAKGTIGKTENYSIFEPEVKDPSDPSGGVSHPHLNNLQRFDKIYVAGQAKSHCVLESVKSLQRWFPQDRAVMGKIHLLMNQMSSVVSPGIDFDAIANAEFAKFEKAGMQLVKP